MTVDEYDKRVVAMSDTRRAHYTSFPSLSNTLPKEQKRALVDWLSQLIAINLAADRLEYDLVDEVRLGQRGNETTQEAPCHEENPTGGQTLEESEKEVT